MMKEPRYLCALLLCFIVNNQLVSSAVIGRDGKTKKVTGEIKDTQQDIPRVFHVSELKSKGDEMEEYRGNDGPLEKGLWGKREWEKPMPPSHALKEVLHEPLEKGLWGKRSVPQHQRRKELLRDARYSIYASRYPGSFKRETQNHELTLSEDEHPKAPKQASFSVLEKGLWGKRDGNIEARLDERERLHQEYTRKRDSLTRELAERVMKYLE